MNKNKKKSFQLRSKLRHLRGEKILKFKEKIAAVVQGKCSEHVGLAKTCAAQQDAWTNRPLQCGNLRYKWIMLIRWAEWCTLAEMTHCEILFVPLLLTPELPPSDTRSSPPPPQFIYLMCLHSLLTSSGVFETKMKTGSLLAGGCSIENTEICPAFSSGLLPAPTYSSFPSSTIYIAF